MNIENIIFHNLTQKDQIQFDKQCIMFRKMSKDIYPFSIAFLH